AEGTTLLQRAVALAPANAQAHIQLGRLLVETGRRDEALAAYRGALALHPHDPTLRIGATIAELPMICADAAEIERCRASYSAGLDALEKFFAGRRADPRPDGAKQDANAVGTAQPFFLPYHGRNDRELQVRYGRMVCAIMAAAYPQFAQAPAVAPP